MFYSKIIFLPILVLFLNLNLLAQVLESSNSKWSVGVKYVEPGTINLYSSTSDNSKIIGHYYYLDKVLILNDKDTYVKFGWVKVIYPNEGFVLEDALLDNEQKTKLDERFKNNLDDINSTQNWKPYIIPCDKEYSFIKSENDFDKETIGIISEDDEVLAITNDGLLEKEWIEIYFPQKGFLFANDLSLIKSNHQLGIGLSYGFINIPYEKNLENYKNPIGGFIEYTKTNWDFLFRIGYNQSQSNLKEYILQSDVFYLHIQYSFLHLFNNHIRFYALAGGGYWNSKFQFTKYPSLEDYFPEETDNGFGYFVGGGIEYSLSGFFIGVQYSFFGTEEAKFGPDPIPGEFTTQYNLFIGSNQVEVDLGYRFEF
jgi:hypothetical protein